MNSSDQTETEMPTSSPSPSSSNKRVTFNENITGVEILSLYDYTPAEISAAWFDEEEMEGITKRCFKVLKKIEAGKGKKYCTRGLEGHTVCGSICKRNNRSAAIQAVLQEQSLQWVDKRDDVQAIADLYIRTSSSCQMWARVVGKRDQEAAEANLDDDDINFLLATKDLTVADSMESSSSIPKPKPILCRKPRSLHNMLQSNHARAA